MRYVLVMAAVTAAYIAVVIVLAVRFGFVNFDCLGSRRSGCLGPNDWGDVLLAGVFAPLAWLWFVFTALMQAS
jgi:hypothetical protein